MTEENSEVNVGVQQAEQLPLPEIDTSGDEDLIRMAMIGAFLVGYNGARQLLESVEDATELLSDAAATVDNVREKVALIKEVGTDLATGGIFGTPIGSGFTVGKKFVTGGYKK